MEMTLDQAAGVVRLTALDAQDLEALWVIDARFHPHVERVITDAGQVPYYDMDAGLGLAWMVRGQPVRVLTGLVLQLDWLSCRPPVQAAEQSRANAAARIGNALLDGIQRAGIQQH